MSDDGLPLPNVTLIVVCMLTAQLLQQSGRQILGGNLRLWEC